ncbi:MAG: arginine--tRNA ligase [Bacteroidales bacterium]|nr:arginine--tRNA ligase [Bacteroidales bacterium]
MFSTIRHSVVRAIKVLKGLELSIDQIQLEETPEHFTGDITILFFPLAKMLKVNPEQLAHEVAEYLQNNDSFIENHHIIKGFLNIRLKDRFLLRELIRMNNTFSVVAKPKKILIEYSSPNTNKPLHLGHLRNHFLGDSIARILQSVGHDVVRINLINDRGIHICKAMLAYQKWGNGETPETVGMKPDHWIGKYYVLFEQQLKKEMVEYGLDEKSIAQAPLMQEALDMLRRWENHDADVLEIWNKLRNYALEGFNQTYRRTNIHFDLIQFESEWYEMGRQIILSALEKKSQGFYKDETGAIMVDLSSEGLDQKVLLRSDGTSVYITQDVGVAVSRFEQYQPDQMLYVVGNEQEYHFKVLKAVLKKMGFDWADRLCHYSYGMVELPEGKMKSREGKVVDADDLLDQLHQIAAEISENVGRAHELDPSQKEFLYEQVGQAALRYFILKVDPAKNIIFDPKENIDFNGNTGPFLQYTHARIRSLLSRAQEEPSLNLIENLETMHEIERKLSLALLKKDDVILEAAQSLNPSLLANYLYELASAFNSFYQEVPVIREGQTAKRYFRLFLASQTGETLNHIGSLLGIYMPEKM